MAVGGRHRWPVPGRGLAGAAHHSPSSSWPYWLSSSSSRLSAARVASDVALGVDLYRDADQTVPEDLLHCDARVSVKGGQERAARLLVPWTVMRRAPAFLMRRSKLRMKFRGWICVR